MPTATLAITGDLETLSKVALAIHEQFPDEAKTTVATTDVMGYNPATARLLYSGLAAPQRDLLRRVVAGNGGLDLDEIRDGPGGGLRGLTGPISKRVKRLIAEGKLPQGTHPPTSTVYDPENRSYQRAKMIWMDPSLVPVFEEALRDQ